jgi:hypothetical protein
MRLDRYLNDDDRRRPLSAEEADHLWDQWADAYGTAQASYDDSVRNLAAGGIAVSATLAAAFEAIGWTIAVAVTLFVLALFFNLISHGAAQLDIGHRLDATRRLERPGALGNRWTSVTTTLNVLAGVTVLGGGIALAVFVFITI